MRNIACRFIAAALSVSLLLSGCVTGAPKYTSAPPAFEKGLTALGQKDFALASYHFAELAKEGNPAAMNNLGVALLMLGRRDEAVYWFSKAARYGNIQGRDTLANLGEAVPQADLVGQHPTQLQREATDKFVAAVVVGALIGVTLHYASKNETLSSNFNPSLLEGVPPSRSNTTQGTSGYQTRDSFGNLVNSRDSYQTRDSFGNLVNSRDSFQTRDSFGNLVNSKNCFQTKDSFGNLVRSGGC